MTTNYDDVLEFSQKFNLPLPTTPALLPMDVALYREHFLREEVAEFKQACLELDLPKAADALVDVVYVAMGTATLMGLPWQSLWDEVQRANLSKERTRSVMDSLLRTGRGHVLDIVKPIGWVPPDIRKVLVAAGWTPP